MIRLYGIPNCDTMKTARRWLDGHGIEYDFHDFKKKGLDAKLLDSWIKAVGWDVLLNKRGMMWRKVPDEIRDNIDQKSARKLMLETPSIIKRPVLDTGSAIHVGFKQDEYEAIFS